MKYETKSILIGRMKRESKEDLDRPCFISMFNDNDPHKTGEVPKKRLDIEHITRIRIKGLDVDYLLLGNDILINDLKSVDIDQNATEILITGNQETV